MSELISILIRLQRRALTWTPRLSVFFSSVLTGFGGRGRLMHQAHAVPEHIDLPLDFVMAVYQVIKARLVPLEAGCCHELHPVASRRFIRRLRAAVPHRDVRVARHEIVRRRIRARALDRLVDQHAVREIELEVLLVEIKAVSLVPLVRALIERDGRRDRFLVLRDHLEQLHLLVFVSRIPRIVEPRETGHPPAAHRPVVARFDRARTNPRCVFRKQLHPLVRWVAVRIEKNIRQPRAPDLRSNAALRIYGISLPLSRHDIHAERPEITRVQHEVRVIFCRSYASCAPSAFVMG